MMKRNRTISISTRTAVHHRWSDVTVRGFRHALVIACALLVTATRPSIAAENDPGIWATFSTTDAFSTSGGDSRWRYWFDAQIRYFDIGTGINQYVARPAVGYRPGSNVTVWAGYARIRTRNRAGNEVNENRYWQQVDWRAGQWANGQVTMRGRFEQRAVDIGDDTGLVLRFVTKYVRPIKQTGQMNLVLAIEPFFNLRDTDWGGKSGIAQNRLFAGLGFRLSEKISLEAGYMNQYIWANGGEDLINHLAVANFRLTL